MRTAVISLTESGRLLSRRIADILPETERWCFARHTDADAESFTDLAALTAELFSRQDALLFVCACGIAVRMTAPHLHSKLTDPAVLVADAEGRFVIPILSGHIGGANALAVRIAEALGAQAVLTTATDVGGVFSPDSFAAANHLHMTDPDAAKAIACAALDGEPIGIVTDYPYRNLPRELSADPGTRTGLYIGIDDRRPFPVTLRLVPQDLVLGIGCKRGTPAETIGQAVLTALTDAGLAMERIGAVATIDLKAQEPGLVAFCRQHRLPLIAYTAAELMEVEGDFTASAFVRQVTGADNVCERSAVRCSGGTLILHKTAADGVTCAAAQQEIILDFERSRV
ncbi:MAG: cobalt-precorrin 5A hydrolase [Oscillospiraceae bacterium]|nr:cobalt-precorrin 5A hydrolase [Oscillospiraceae bacterium]